MVSGQRADRPVRLCKVAMPAIVYRTSRLVCQFQPILVAFAWASANAVSSDATGGPDEETTASQRYCDPAVVAIAAWLALVTGLEVNDFRYHLKLAYGQKAKENGSVRNIVKVSPTETIERASPSPRRRCSNYLIENVFLSDNYYVASLVAIQLGFRDAIVDAIILYSLTYATIIAFTWSHVESNFLLVIWGVSFMVSAIVLTLIGWKLPQWMGFYRKSNFNFLNDTSKFAPQAVIDHIFEGTSLASFRYQVRLGVGIHTNKFVLALLPFYVNLRIYSFFISLLAGLVSACLYRYTIFRLRQKFTKRRRERVLTIGASAVLLLISSAVFAIGIRFIDTVWNWNFHLERWKISIISYFCWLAPSLLFLGIYYYEQELFKQAEVSKIWQEEKAMEVDNGDENQATEENIQGEDVHPGVDEESSEGCTKLELNEPSKKASDRRAVFKKDAMESYIYETVHFDRVTLTGASITTARLERESTTDRDKTSKEIYDEIAKADERNQCIEWHRRLWRTLPFLPAWHICMHQNAILWSCCRKDSVFNTQPYYRKIWHVFGNTFRICIYLLALCVTVIGCGSAVQTKTALAKLPESFKISYENQNVGAVCAFDVKFGDIREFASKDEAHLANYTIAHCGPCAACSTWNDLQVQYSTRRELALLGRKCAQKTILGGIEAAFDCTETTIGFKGDCARCWVDSFLCSKKFCSFIFLQSTITNRIGNFRVNPESVTSAMCSEANCEAGNPGDFVRCSGSNRRKMNIKSDIERPRRELCQIVDVAKSEQITAEGIVNVNDWGSFFDLE